MADQNPNPNPNPDPNGDGNGDGGEKKTEKFTQEQLDAIVAKRVNEANAKAEKTIAEKIAEAQADADRKAQLSAEEREKEEKAKMDKLLSDREQTLAIREARIEATALLQSKGISSDLVDFVVDADLEKTKSNIDVLEKSFTKAVEAGVADKLKGKSPEDFSGDAKPKNGSVARNGQVAF